MSHLYDLAIAFSNKVPPPGDMRNATQDWTNACGAMCNQFQLYVGGWNPAPGDYGPDADAIGDNSGPLNTNASAAPINAWHFWYVGTSGHVASDLNGGGSACFMASTRSGGLDLGHALRIMSVGQYNATGGVTYRGWSTNYWGGRGVYVEPAPAAPNQRQVLATSGVKRRAQPIKNDALYPGINPPIAANTVTTPLGWVTGDGLDGLPWYANADGTYSHSSGFTDTGTHDLADLNPAPAGQRTVLTTAAANVRSGPTTTDAVVDSYPAGSNQHFTYWTTGEAVNGIDLWYANVEPVVTRRHTALGRSAQEFLHLFLGETLAAAPVYTWSWAGGYTTQDKADLTELPYTPEPPKWPAEDYTFPAAGSFVDRVVGADWSNFENEWSVPNPAERKGFPDLPTSVVIHQWGNPGDYTIGSVINTFTHRHEDTGDRVSAHFVVDGNEIVQMVSLDDRAYHAGSGGNDWVGIEADPLMTPEVIENIRKVLIYLRDRNAGVPLTNVLHRDVPGAATSCGEWIAPHLDELDVSEPDPGPEPGPDVPPAWYLDFIEGLGVYLQGWVTSTRPPASNGEEE